MVAKGIRPIGRTTQGVRLIEIDGDDRVVSLARLADQELTEQATDDEVETSDIEDEDGGGPVEG